MPEYLSPGVYIEEVDKGPKPIEGVGTSTAVFIGYSEKASTEQRRNGKVETNRVLYKPQLVTNWSQYVETFGGFVDGAYMPQAVYGFFLNGGTRCYVCSVKTIEKAKATLVTGADGNPVLHVEARQAGFDGALLRVKIEAAPAADAPKDAGSDAQREAAGEGAKDAGAGAAKRGKSAAEADKASSAPALEPFTVVVEREEFGDVIEKERAVITLKASDPGKNGLTPVEVITPDRLQWVSLVAAPLGKGEDLSKRKPDAQAHQLGFENKQIAPATFEEFAGDIDKRTGMAALQAQDDINIVVVPDVMSPPPGGKLDRDSVIALQRAMIDHCEFMKDRVAILDTPPGLNAKEARIWRRETTKFDSSYAAMYYPWIQVQDPVSNRPIMIPPSGHMAGIWARSDNTRGVHKAPANETIRGVIGLEREITKGEQDTLNPEGVNCIRAFPGMGIRVWGARTLSGSNPSWRYLNVRRLFNYVEKSIERNTQWVVFEPNDPRLWGRIRRDVTAFLTNVWRTGALFGLTPEEAFYVKCDEETNPQSQRDVGMLVIEIGIAPVKPAEFVIFRISQWAGPGSEE